ncbi:MAG: hypothetical protein H6988_06360 [Pseudomonadales bacterium]|nr:hypothetical protein [Halieaceae bacterium]MCP5190002.1 hypothetical protein [Pseudomonadales bacterium]MCP5205377.1 hypothetical protein [Pseudomonadales bacterium]
MRSPIPFSSGLACAVALNLCCFATPALAEGSRNLYPASYPSTGNVADGARANLDLQTGAGSAYLNRVIRRGFIYVYAEAGEYILTGSSNVGSGGQINVYNPQEFGTRGNETVPAAADFTCTGAGGAGSIGSRAQELAGPNSTAVNTGFNPCSYQAPVTGIYGVVFTTGSGGGPNARVDLVSSSNNSVAAWDVTVRSAPTSATDINGRVHTFAFPGFTGGNSRPLYSTLYYVTSDGYRYQQDLRGLDPNGYALYANTFGFLDNNEPLYKSLRGDNAVLDRNLPAGVATQQAQFPIFFSDLAAAATEAELEKVLQALGIPLQPPSPEISNVQFTGAIGGHVTATGVGGTFSFDTTATVSYQIIISRDRVDFDPANPNNRLLTGIAYSGTHQVAWDGLDNNHNPFPPSGANPYPYKAYGRNGEVHFPIVDAENNNAGAQPGGPTITRLNGAAPNDRTVFFDDRGYVTSSGEAVGVLNGTLCDGPVPAAANPPVSLEGVDSAGNYRSWQSGGNSNSDCAASAGWGDAKAVNLWTYFLTPEFSDEIEIIDVPVDLGTAVAMPVSAAPGATVAGVFSFVNNGATAVDAVSYTMNLTPGLSNVSFANLPPLATASYNPGTGVVTLGNFPTTLAPGQLVDGMTFSYDAPASGVVTVTTGISTAGATADSVPDNDNASASTAVGDFDVYTRITGVPATASPGATIGGTVSFANAGPQDAGVTAYSFTIGEPGNTPDNVQFSGLPAGVGASYDDTSGVVTLSGMPSVLAVGDVISLAFSFTAPDTNGASVPLTSGVTTVTGDADPSNNAAVADTLIVVAPAPAPPAAPVGIPTLPAGALLSLLLMLGIIGGRRARREGRHPG